MDVDKLNAKLGQSLDELIPEEEKKPETRKCHRCGAKGHIKPDCPNPDTRICHNCGQVGHISKYCHLPPQKKRGRGHQHGGFQPQQKRQRKIVTSPVAVTFEIGARVKVEKADSPHNGREGSVCKVSGMGLTFLVDLDIMEGEERDSEPAGEGPGLEFTFSSGSWSHDTAAVAAMDYTALVVEEVNTFMRKLQERIMAELSLPDLEKISGEQAGNLAADDNLIVNISMKDFEALLDEKDGLEELVQEYAEDSNNIIKRVDLKDSTEAKSTQDPCFLKNSTEHGGSSSSASSSSSSGQQQQQPATEEEMVWFHGTDLKEIA